MSKTCRRIVYALVVLTFLLPACSLKKAVQQAAPERRHFVLEASRTASSGTTQGDGVLYVRGMTVSPRYEGAGFVYKQGESEYATDFYNRFLVPPDLLVTQEVRNWVMEAGLFGSVVSSGSLISPTHALEGRVNALYGDHSVQPPKAVLEIEFFLIDDPLGRSAVLLQERYREEAPLDGRSPASLVGGWNTALAQILGKLEQELGAIELQAAHESGGH